MRGFRLASVGGTPELVELSVPSAQPGQVVVPVRAAALNPVDLKMADDPSLQVPRVVGNEAVVDIGGTRSYAERTIAPYGALAEQAVVDPELLVPLPDDVDDPTALAVGIAGIAAWMSLHHVARVRADETVVVLGATGAVGRLAVQLAHRAGARVVAVGRSVDRLAALPRLGADATVALGEGYPERLRAAAGGAADVVVDLVFGPPLVGALGATGLGARLVCVGTAGVGEISLPFEAIRGRHLLTYSNRLTPPEPKREAYVELLELARSGRLDVSTEVLPLRSVDRAWALQRSSPGHKLVVTIAD